MRRACLSVTGQLSGGVRSWAASSRNAGKMSRWSEQQVQRPWCENECSEFEKQKQQREARGQVGSRGKIMQNLTGDKKSFEFFFFLRALNFILSGMGSPEQGSIRIRFLYRGVASRAFSSPFIHSAFISSIQHCPRSWGVVDKRQSTCL